MRRTAIRRERRHRHQWADSCPSSTGHWRGRRRWRASLLARDGAVLMFLAPLPKCGCIPGAEEAIAGAGTVIEPIARCKIRTLSLTMPRRISFLLRPTVWAIHMWVPRLLLVEARLFCFRQLVPHSVDRALVHHCLVGLRLQMD